MKCWNCENEIIGEQFEFIQDGSDYFCRTEKQFEAIDKRARRIVANNGEMVATSRKYCQDCFEELSTQQKSDIDIYLKLKCKLMVERAIRMIEEQGIEIYDYKEAIDTVSEYAKANREKFMSAHEVVAAIILIANEIKTKVQYQVGKYHVDFLLPTLHVVLEIDGYMHDHSKKKDVMRDIDVRNALGADWEVVRIPTKNIEKRAELLVEAIKTAKKEKQETRKKNNGILPEQFKYFQEYTNKRVFVKQNAEQGSKQLTTLPGWPHEI